MSKIWDAIVEAYDPGVAVEQLVSWLPNLVVALLTSVLFFVFYKVARRSVAFVFKRADVDATVSNFMDSVIGYALGVIWVITILGQLGVNITSLVASLGVAGLTIGFAAQDALSNVISGLFIFWDRPFVVGDLVEIEGKYGRVDRITMRTTRVVTNDGKMLAIPNRTVVNTTVASYTNFPNLRLEIDITVGVAEDLGRIRRLLLDLVDGRPGFMTKPEPQVVVTALNDYNVAIQLRAWIEDETTHLRERFALREDAYAALNGAGVDMPFETLQIVRPAAES